MQLGLYVVSITTVQTWAPVLLLTGLTDLLAQVYTLVAYRSAGRKAQRNNEVMMVMFSEWGKIMDTATAYERAHFFGNVKYEVRCSLRRSLRGTLCDSRSFCVGLASVSNSASRSNWFVASCHLFRWDGPRHRSIGLVSR